MHILSAGTADTYISIGWKNDFDFKDIFYCSESNTPEDKLKDCLKYSAVLMIEDKPEVALHLTDNNIKVLLFDARYNQDVNHDNIIRVYDWNDVYKKIVQIENL